MGGKYADVGRKLSVDSDGNVLVTGYYVINPFTLYNADGTAFGTTLSKSTGYDIFMPNTIRVVWLNGLREYLERVLITGMVYLQIVMGMS